KHSGFTLIELVVVIAILAILAAFALPRFAQLSEQAHQSSIRATSGALAAGVALAKTQWVSNGLTSSSDNVAGFGNDTIDVSDDGWATGTAGNNDPAMTTDTCNEIWTGLLQSNAPTVSSVATGNPDYLTTEDAGDCVFTYQLDGQGSNIEYDANTGEITTTIN
ncbi:prepilin-type N-terminal cleavage/methylation domain-containing protein, partial [Marinobacter sediminum]|uniref:prepilin-type N-terminal cleavage/methylation domain-containing protein n=1 Tax=Marinobacter sediminum TaxID=256323 RepID=UPI003569A832